MSRALTARACLILDSAGLVIWPTSPTGGWLRLQILQLVGGLLKRVELSLLLLEGHLLLLVDNTLLNDGVDLFDGRARVVCEQDLLLACDPLLLLQSQLLHLLLLMQALSDFFVSARWRRLLLMKLHLLRPDWVRSWRVLLRKLASRSLENVSGGSSLVSLLRHRLLLQLVLGCWLCCQLSLVAVVVFRLELLVMRELLLLVRLFYRD